MTATNASNTDWTALQQAEDMAYFKADLCLYSPESYSLEEKKEICSPTSSTAACSSILFPGSRAICSAMSNTCSALFAMITVL